jgi:hypothetical protein
MHNTSFPFDDLGNLPLDIVERWRAKEYGFFERELIDRMTRAIETRRRPVIEQAMLLEAPEVAALGFDAYLPKLAIDREGGAIMVMLDQGGSAWRPIVFFPEVGHGVQNGRLVSSYTPLAGAQGWQAFQDLRSSRNIGR